MRFRFVLPVLFVAFAVFVFDGGWRVAGEAARQFVPKTKSAASADGNLDLDGVHIEMDRATLERLQSLRRTHIPIVAGDQERMAIFAASGPAVLIWIPFAGQIDSWSEGPWWKRNIEELGLLAVALCGTLLWGRIGRVVDDVIAIRAGQSVRPGIADCVIAALLGLSAIVVYIMAISDADFFEPTDRTLTIFMMLWVLLLVWMLTVRTWQVVPVIIAWRKRRRN